MTTTDYTRLQQDYAQACEVIARLAETIGEQKKQIKALRNALEPFARNTMNTLPDGWLMVCVKPDDLQAARAALALGSTPPASGSTPAQQEPADGC